MKTLIIPVLLALLLSVNAQSAPPDIQTPSPVIYLADNLDEADNLGWCIDTLGRGFAEKIQAHSCKPRGGDVQFSFDLSTGQIQSVEFPAYCMEYLGSMQPPFGLIECNATKVAQRYSYDSDRQTLMLADDPSQCVVIGETSRSAGPFMSRDLLLASCDETPALYRTWIIAP